MLVMPAASSCRFAFASMMPPASRIRRMMKPSRAGWLVASATEPAEVGRSPVS